MPDDTWQCAGCKETYSLDEETDGERNADYAEQFFCDECDDGKTTAYCGDCSLLFEETNVVVCQDCLDKAMQECKNIHGKVIEKIVERPVYVKDSTRAQESMEDFERRILGR